jgi:hypothetical protein
LLTFFLSAVLDNLTTSIVMISLLRKLIKDQPTRWTFAGMVVIAANAGGAWSPIGDVTTTMLWIGEQISAGAIVKGVFLTSLTAMVVPAAVLSFTLKGELQRPDASDQLSNQYVTDGERKAILFAGVGGLLFVPIFKTITQTLKEDGLHLFPELYLTGYPLQDLVLQRPFIDAYLFYQNRLDEWAKKQNKLNLTWCWGKCKHVGCAEGQK